MAVQPNPTYDVVRIAASDLDTVVDLYRASWEQDDAALPRIRRRSAWLYQQNPAGPAEIFALRTGGDWAGMLALIPRRLWLRDHEALAMFSCDFAVRREHRSALPALKLQRAAREFVTSRGAIQYAIPNDHSRAVIGRLGEQRMIDRPRLARPLRHREFLKDRHPLVRSPAALVLDAAVRISNRIAAGSAPGLRTEWVHEFDGRFDALWRQARDGWNIGERTAEYLTWRFAAEPEHDIRILTVVDARNAIAGYAIFELTGTFLTFRDLLAVPDDEHRLRGILARMMTAVSATAAHSASILVTYPTPLGRALESLGFRRRESEVAFVHPPDRDGDWHLTRADEDV